MVTIEFSEPAMWDYFRARHVATSIDSAFCVGQAEPGQAARRRLRQRRFDQAPVVSEPARVVGWVAADQLRDDAAVGSAMTSLDESAIVSTESPIANVLRLLGQHGLVFTVGENGLSGFIVHSDLDRQPARTHFYLLVAGIEILLSEIIRSALPMESAIEAMNAGMVKEYKKAKNANSEAHPVEYLYLTALVKLFLDVPLVKNSNSLSEASIDWLKNLNKFRRLVMHPACSIAAARSPAEIAEFTRIAANVIEQLQTLSGNCRQPSTQMA
jgi:CBS domain-containing protein